MGICLAFGAGGRRACLDAQLRHSAPDAEMALMGFQFVDLEADYAREALAVIADKLSAQGWSASGNSSPGRRGMWGLLKWPCEMPED